MGNKTIQIFKGGQQDTPNRERQLKDEFVINGVVEYDTVPKTFSNRAKGHVQPKHTGDIMTKRIHYGVTHPDSLVSLEEGDLDVSNLYTTVHVVEKRDNALLTGKSVEYPVYSVAISYEDVQAETEANGTTVAYEMDLARQNLIDTIKLSGFNVDGTTVTFDADKHAIRHSMGDMFGVNGGSTRYAGEMTQIPETGGTMNSVFNKDVFVSAKITSHGLNMPYSVMNDNLSSIKGELKYRIQDLANARGEAIEKQVEESILSAAASNVLYTGSAICDTEVCDPCDYDDLTALEMALIEAEVPTQTTMMTGTQNADNVSVSDGYVAYIHPFMIPTIRKMTVDYGSGSVKVFEPVEKYAAGGKTLPNEIGKVGSFRFVSVPKMNYFAGAGANATSDVRSTNGKTDIFPILIVGDDSFETGKFDFNNTNAAHIPPKRDVHNDMYARTGAIVTEWSFGFLAYRPERLRMIKSAALKV
jgi:N4-gp56 family major capsid protein